MKINLLPKKEIKNKTFKLINIISMTALIFNMSMIGVFITPKVASANGNFGLELSQWADKAPVNWQHGNLNSSNSAYHEGESVPFMLELTNLIPDTDYNIRVRYDFQKGTKNAYDYLTTYDRSRTPSPIPGGTPVTIAIPTDGGLSFTQVPGVFTLWDGAFVGTPTGPTTDVNEKYYDLTLHSSGEEMTLLWSGHLASDVDWGAGNGASSISGSPFHQAASRIVDGNEQSSQDRSIQPGAVLPPVGSITVYKYDDQQNLLPGATFQVCSTALPQCLVITDGQAPDTLADGIVYFGNLETSVAGIDYDVSETAAPSGWIKDNSVNTLILTSVNPDKSTEFYNTPSVCDLTITKTVDKYTANPDDLLLYTLNFSNSGNTNCTGGGVRVDDYIPDYTTYADWHDESSDVDFGYGTKFTGIDNPTGYNAQENLLSWNAYELVPGESGWVKFKVTVDQLPACTDITINNYGTIYADQLQNGLDSNVEETTVSTPCEGSLTVNKYFDDNGDGQIDRTNPQGWTWDIVNGTQDIPGGDTETLVEDTYTVTEDSLQDYSTTWQCSDQTSDIGTNFDVFVPAETDVVCSFTNTRQTGDLTIYKYNDQQQPQAGVDFNVNGAEANRSGQTNGSGVLVFTDLPTGPYTVTETEPTDYHFDTVTDDCSPSTNPTYVTVTTDNQSCTFTNARDRATLKVFKHVNNNYGGTLEADDFTMNVTGNNVSNPSFPGNEAGTTVTLDAGSYSVNEIELPGYTKTLGPDCSGTVVSGDHKTCTITNTRDTGTIKVNKQVDTDGNGTFEGGNTEANALGFVWGINAETPGRTMGSDETVVTGSYDITENAVTYYHFVGWYTNGSDYSCDNPEGNSLPANINVSKDNTTEITLCNARDTGTIKVNKQVDADGNGTFESGNTEANALGFVWGINAETPDRTMGSSATVFTVNYNIIENSVFGYHFVGWYTNMPGADFSCNNPEGTSLPANITVSKDQITEITLCNSHTSAKLSKEAPAQVNAGDNITYTIKWEITGIVPATNVNLWDFIPANTSYVSAYCGSTTGTCNISTDGTPVNKVMWELGNRNPGENGTITLVVKTNSPLADGTIITNTAYLDSAETDPALQAVAQTEIVSGPILNITKSDTPDPVKPADNINYTINWSISGNDTAHNVKITDVIPTNTTYVSVADGGVYDVLTNTITWTLGTKNPGDSGSVHFVVKVNTPLTNGTVIKNTATIDCDETPPTSADANTTVVAAPVLKITKSVDQTFVNPGGTANYTVVIENTGNDTAINVKLNDLLPSGFTFTDYGTNTHTFSLGNLAAGAKVSVTYNVTIGTGVAAGTYENLAVAWADNHGNVTAKVPLEVRIPKVLGEEPKPDLTIEKTVDKSIANPGNVIKYTVKVTNNGDATAINVQLQDVLPAGFTFDGSDNISKTWDLGDIIVGETKQVTYSVKIDDKILPGNYENLVVAWADNHDQVTDFATVEVRVIKVLAETGPGTLDYLYFFGAGTVLLTSLYVLGLTRRKEEK